MLCIYFNTTATQVIRSICISSTPLFLPSPLQACFHQGPFITVHVSTCVDLLAGGGMENVFPLLPIRI